MSRFSPGVIAYVVFVCLQESFTYSFTSLESLSIDSSVLEIRPITVDNATSDSLSFEEAIQLSKDLLNHPVVIAQFLLQHSDETRNINVNIDSTISTLLIGICDDGQGHLTDLIKEIGADNEGDDRNVLTGSDWEILTISNPTRGRWPMHFPDNSSYEIIFLGESKTDVDISIVDKVTGESIPGNPITGSEQFFMVTVTNLEDLCNISRIIMINREGMEISSYQLGHPHGRQKNIYLVHARIPNQVFKVKLLAYEACQGSSTPITRISHVTFTPVTFSVSLLSVLPDTIDSGSSLNVQIVLRNMKSTADLFNLTMFEREQYTKKELFHASWNNAEVEADTSSSFPVTIMTRPHDTVSDLELVITGINSNGMRQTITKKIVLLPSRKTKNTTINHQYPHMGSTNGPVTSKTHVPYSISTYVSTHIYHSRDHVESTDYTHSKPHTPSTKATKHRVSRHSKRPKRTTRIHATRLTDLNPPSFSMIRFKDRCKHKETCSRYQWTVFFQVQDNESGIHRIDVEDKTFSTVITESFSDGQANTPIHGNVSTTCCHGDTAIIVEDKQGNRLRYPVRYSDHVTQDTGFTFNTYSGIVVGSLACVMILIILVTAVVHFRTKVCFHKQSWFKYRQTINQTLPTPKRTKIISAQIV